MAWPEQKKPVQTPSGIQQKAPVHRQVALSKEYSTTARTPVYVPRPSKEEQDFMSNPAKYINELAPLFTKALQSPQAQKWKSREDYIKLIIKKALDHTVKAKEASHFLMYLKEMKDDLSTSTPVPVPTPTPKEESQEEQLDKIHVISVKYLETGDTIQKVLDQSNYTILSITESNVIIKDPLLTRGPYAKPKIIEIKDGNIHGFTLVKKNPIDATLIEVQKMSDVLQTMGGYDKAMKMLADIAIEYHPSITQQEKMRNLAKELTVKANNLTKPKESVHTDLVNKIYAATTIQQLDDLNQDANRAEIKGQITNAQLQEIYMLINARDEQVRKASNTRLVELQAKYHKGDFLERLPNIDSAFKEGVYTITDVVMHQEHIFGNMGPSEVRTVNEYKLAKVQADGTLIPVTGMTLTVSTLENTFKKTSYRAIVEENKMSIEKSKDLLIESINKTKKLSDLNQIDMAFHQAIADNKLNVMNEKVSEIARAISAKRRELSSTQNRIIKSVTDWEEDRLKYEAEHKPSEMLPPKEFTDEDVKKHTWGLTEAEAIKKYTEKEQKKYQSNVDYVNKEKETLEEMVKTKPHVLLTKAQIQKQYPEKAEEYIRDLWNYKQAKANYEKNSLSAKYWQEKLDRIRSGDWAEKNTNYLREQYQKEVKEAIKHGKPVPYDVIKQYPEFTKAQNARERYDKGKHTSFANVSIAIDTRHQVNRGIKIKLQDGKAMDDAHADQIIKTLDQYQSAVGDITQIMKRENLTIAHTKGKHPFLSTFAGVYHPTDKTVTMGYEGVAAHELTHFVDETAKKHKDQPLYDYKLLGFAKVNMNSGVERAISLSKNKSEDELERARELRLHLGGYWQRPEELFARLVEQYTAYKNRGSSGTLLTHYPYEEYIKTPAYWENEIFMQMIPQIEAELQRKIKLAQEV